MIYGSSPLMKAKFLEQLTWLKRLSRMSIQISTSQVIRVSDTLVTFQSFSATGHVIPQRRLVVLWIWSQSPSYWMLERAQLGSTFQLMAVRTVPVKALQSHHWTCSVMDFFLLIL